MSAGLVDQAGRQALLVVQQNLEDVERSELLMAFPDRQGLRGLDETPHAFGQFLDIHVQPSKPAAASRSGKAAASKQSTPFGGLGADMGKTSAGCKGA
jgi:hypothetical protein